MSVWKALVIIFLPLVLRQLARTLAVLRDWRKHVVFYRASTKLEKIFLGALLINAAFLLKSVVLPEKFYFAITKTPVDSPSYLIRNKFRSFVEESIKKDSRFEEMINRRKNIIENSSDVETTHEVYSDHHSIEKNYIELERLSMDLRSKDTRKKYALYGPDSLNCSVCNQESWSYLVLIAPQIIEDYLLSLLLIGLVCFFPHKQRWMNCSIFFVAIVVALEILEWIASDDHSTFLSSIIPNSEYLTKLEQLRLVRRFLLLLLNSIVLSVDLPAARDMLRENLKKIVNQTEYVAAKLQYSRIARIAIALDDKLRDFDLAHRKRRDCEIKEYFQTPELKSLRTEIAHRHNLQDVMNAEQKFVATFENWFHA